MTGRRDRIADAPLLAWGDTQPAEAKPRPRPHRRIALVGGGIAILLLSAALPPPPRLVWNASSSAPIGLYAVSPGAPVLPGQMVVARVPKRFRRLAAERRYLPANVPLVKRVAAVAGDEVCALGREIFVNGQPLAERRTRDASSRPMLLWKGCVRLHGRQLFLLMDHPASFDGRYFGVTDGGDVVGKARLLWRR